MEDGHRLVTGHESTLCVYEWSSKQKYLVRTHCLGNLAGTIVGLETIHPNTLVVAFAGPPKLCLLQIAPSDKLTPLSLIDLSEFVSEGSDIDVQLTANASTTLACLLDGGSDVVVLNVVRQTNHTVVVGQHYRLPLGQLILPHHPPATVDQPTLSTGFGDVLDTIFLEGYLEPVLVVLHSDPSGRVWQGRWGKSTGQLYCTALSVSTQHQRTAVLWSTPVSVDALRLTVNKQLIFVVGANEITVLNRTGKEQQCLGVNGWAMSHTATANPVVKLSVALDGSKWAWLNERVAMVCLRYGQIYVFQAIDDDSNWCLLPTGKKLGSLGEIAALTSRPNDSLSGLLVAGSRLGDSVVLEYQLSFVETTWGKLGGLHSQPRANNRSTQSMDETIFSGKSSTGNSYREETIRLEDEALYGSSAPGTAPNLVVPSDDEEDQDENDKLVRVAALEALEPVDSFVNAGSLGASCEGPISGIPSYLDIDDSETDVFGAPAMVMPSGFGSSGGLALVTVPGRDDRMILAEHDCLNVESVFSLPLSQTILLGMSPKGGGGIKVLRKQDASVSEIDVGQWLSSVQITGSKLLGAGEGSEGLIALVLQPAQQPPIIVVANQLDGKLKVIYEHTLDTQESIEVLSVTPFVPLKSAGLAFGCLWGHGEAAIFSVDAKGALNKLVVGTTTNSPVDMEIDEEMDQEDRRRKEFYASGSIVAMDLFLAPSSLFKTAVKSKAEDVPLLAAVDELAKPADEAHPDEEVEMEEEKQDWSKLTVPKLKDEMKSRGLVIKGRKADLVAALDKDDEKVRMERRSAAQSERHSVLPATSNSDSNTELEALNRLGSQRAFDEEERELYGIDDKGEGKNDPRRYCQTHLLLDDGAEQSLFVSICRQSGKMDIFQVAEANNSVAQCWTTGGAASGLSVLGKNVTAKLRQPHSHDVSVTEMRLFMCGENSGESAPFSRLCMALKTSHGDLTLYKLTRDVNDEPQLFRRVDLRMVARPSREQEKHRMKLVRKGMVSKSTNESKFAFSHNSLVRFSRLSGLEGLFYAGHRPVWIVGDRGQPAVISHQVRHAAPAGGKPKPMVGFCSLDNGQFLTLHERVGRVGSERLTIFRGLSDALQGNRKGFVAGGNILEKIPFGVTVRRIVFIDDQTASTGQHPLFAVLISREEELDQSAINSDGLSDEERMLIKQEKEKARIAKQVEADLGGFDVDEEWVEEIERENVFEIKKDIGGAPPLLQSIYSLWIVDAANNWMVVDSYELGEHEHGIDLKFMHLTEFKEDPGSASALANEDGEKRPFLVVGTGIVNHNGEDVTTKGRGLLFGVKRFSRPVSSGPVAELSLIYEKNIFHGPVSTVSCLEAEDKHRLVIGAGSDVNIEQWGTNNRLTQVGFFRATMHILDISHFKNFLLLSDAYDSLHFLVWRESDKTLTLLAKDYDPIPVHATGMLSRGSSMTFVCQDDRQNLQFFQYAPGEAAARGGNKLVCRADFHLGRQTTTLSSHYCRPNLLAHSATTDSTYAALKQQDPLFGRQDDDQRLGIHFGTTDGGVGTIVPLSEPVYWRLMALQSVMANALDSDCALNPRAWRLYRRTARRGGCRYNDRKNGVIDGDLVLRFADLAVTDQEDLASSIGSTVGLILDNLIDIQCGSIIL